MRNEPVVFQNATVIRRGDYFVAAFDGEIMKAAAGGLDYPDRMILDCYPARYVDEEGVEFECDAVSAAGVTDVSCLYHKEDGQWRMCAVFNREQSDVDLLAQMMIELNFGNSGSWKLVDFDGDDIEKALCSAFIEDNAAPRG